MPLNNPTNVVSTTFTIPTEVQTRVYDAVAKLYGYQEEIDDPENPGTFIPNPVTKEEFTQQHVIDHLLNIVQSAEVTDAAEISRTSKLSEIQQLKNDAKIHIKADVSKTGGPPGN